MEDTPKKLFRADRVPIKIGMSIPEANATPVLVAGERPDPAITYRHQAVAQAVSDMLILNRFGFSLSEIADLYKATPPDVEKAIQQLPGYLLPDACQERADLEDTEKLEKIRSEDPDTKEEAARLARKGMLFAV